MTFYARLTKRSLNVAGCCKRDTLFRQTVWMLAASVCVSVFVPCLPNKILGLFSSFGFLFGVLLVTKKRRRSSLCFVLLSVCGIRCSLKGPWNNCRPTGGIGLGLFSFSFKHNFPDAAAAFSMYFLFPQFRQEVHCFPDAIAYMIAGVPGKKYHGWR